MVAAMKGVGEIVGLLPCADDRADIELSPRNRDSKET